jgi:hypothetical protein
VPVRASVPPAAGLLSSGVPGSRAVPAVDVVWRIVDGEAFIVDVTTGFYFSLNAVGTAVWTGLERGESPETIAAALARRHGQPLDEVRRDVDDFVAELRAERLLEEGDR